MAIMLEEDFLEERGLALTRLIEQDIRDHLPRYQKVREHRALYDGSISSQMPLPWEGASAINVPLIMKKKISIVPMMVSAFLSIDPVVNVQRSPDEYFSEQTDDIEQFMNFVVDKDIPGFYQSIEMWLNDLTIDGMSTLMTYWKKEYRTVSEIFNLKIMYDTGQQNALGDEVTEAREKTGMEFLVDLFGAPDVKNGIVDAWRVDEFAPEDGEQGDEGELLIETGMGVIGQKWHVEYIKERERKFAEVEFAPTEYVDEIAAKVRHKIVHMNAANVENIEYEDIILPFRSKGIQCAERVTRRFWLTINEIERKRREGQWMISDEDMKRIKAHALKAPQDFHFYTGLQEQKDNLTGEDAGYGKYDSVDLPSRYAPYNSNKVMCYEVYMSDDVGSGEPEEVIYTIIYPLRSIVHAEYLYEVFPHGRRPFVKAKYDLVTNRDYGMGLGDQLAAINMEVNTIINIINNNQNLVNNPWFLYEPMSFNPGDLQGVQPGQGVPCQNPAGVVFPRFNSTPLSDMSMMSSLLMFADQVTVSPLSGGSTQMKNAPRTARGTLALLGEGHVQIDMLINRLQKTAWAELMEQIFGLYQEFCPEEKWYWVTRSDQKRVPIRMTREQLRGKFEFSFKGNTVNTNREVLRTLSQIRYNTLMANPDFMTDPHARQNLLKDFLKYHGDGTDQDRLIPALPGEGAFQHPPTRQQDENKILQMGGYFMPLPTDPHAEHLQIMDQFEQTAMFAQMEPHAVGLWASHKQQHMDYLRAQVQQNQMPAAGAGMANNVPVGESMANAGSGNAGLNVLQGGNV